MAKIKHSIGYDPVRNESAASSVFTFQLPEQPSDKLIVTYAGRPETESFYNELSEIAKYYNCTILEEGKPNPKWIAAMKRPFWRTLRRYKIRQLIKRHKRFIYLTNYYLKIKHGKFQRNTRPA